MIKQNTKRMAEDIERKFLKIDEKKKKKMKVSGAGVKVLQKIIKKKRID